MVHLVFFFSFSFGRRLCATGNLFISKSISKIDKQILIASVGLTVRDSGHFQFLSKCEITTIAGCMSRMSQSSHLMNVS